MLEEKGSRKGVPALQQLLHLGGTGVTTDPIRKSPVSVLQARGAAQAGGSILRNGYSDSQRMQSVGFILSVAPLGSYSVQATVLGAMANAETVGKDPGRPREARRRGGYTGLCYGAECGTGHG
ncbi:hypothetical protein GH733_005736 [Mirounga leonina]|nr:hypothetical protein GH733_005736 [Mirounga leonina]